MEWLFWAFWELCFVETDTGNNFFHFWANLMSSAYHFLFSSKKGSVESQYILLSNDGFYTMKYNGVVPLLQRSVLPPSSEWLNLVWVGASIFTWATIFLYFLPDCGRNFVTYWCWNLITLTDFERKEQKKERDLLTFVYNFTIFMGSSSFYTTYHNFNCVSFVFFICVSHTFEIKLHTLWQETSVNLSP
jgi:hypothetical protein